VTAIEFFKATSGGQLDPIESSAQSLHNRRSIIIKDDISLTLWVIHGSGAAKKTQKSANNQVKEINTANNGRYTVTEIPYDTAEERIEEILAQGSSDLTQTPVKVETIPSVTTKNGSKSKSKAAKEEGPMIKEFQISYFEESSPAKIGDLNINMLRDVVTLLAEYAEQVSQLTSSKKSRKEAHNILSRISNEILDTIYSQ